MRTYFKNNFLKKGVYKMSNEEQNEKDAKRLFELFQKQNGVMSGNISNNTPSTPSGNVNLFDNQGGQFCEYGDGNTIGLGFDNQNPENENNIQLPQMNRKSRPQSQPTSQSATSGLNICPFCKTIHPPLKPGEKCPNAGLGKDQKRFNITDETINKFIVNLKNIIISNLSAKNIKDGTKFFQHAIIELTKIVEQYKE